MTTAAFIGLGVMGAPMCRNLTTKREGAGLAEIRAFDVRAEPLARAGEDGAFIASSATPAAFFDGGSAALVSSLGCVCRSASTSIGTSSAPAVFD